MPIGQLERAAAAGRGDLYPQSLLGRQVYWTALGEFDQEEEALFDEYGNLEPRRGSARSPHCFGWAETCPARPGASMSAIPSPRARCRLRASPGRRRTSELRATAFAHAGQALVEHRVDQSKRPPTQNGALVLAVRPVQINPYWQHGGHANIAQSRSMATVLGRRPALRRVFARSPTPTAIADFDDGDVVRLIETGPRDRPTAAFARRPASPSAACEFAFSLRPATASSVRRFARRCGTVSRRDGEVGFHVHPRRRSPRLAGEAWRAKDHRRRPGAQRHVEAQTAFILVNATRFAFKPGPRNYDRTWIRDGSSQALALLWAGLIEEAKRYVSGIPSAFTRTASLRRSSTSTARSIGVTAATSNSTRKANSSVSPRRSTASPRIALSSRPYSSRSSGRPGSSRSCAREPKRSVGRRPAFTACSRRQSVTRATASRPTAIGTIISRLSALRNCEYLRERSAIVDLAAERRRGEAFAADLARSIRMTAEAGRGLIPGSADREDVDPTSTSIAFEPCRVEDVLPAELIARDLRPRRRPCQADRRARISRKLHTL